MASDFQKYLDGIKPQLGVVTPSPTPTPLPSPLPS
jgi:hypothetical protein